MIHSYQFKNFLSFKDETEISFKLPKSAPQNNLSFNSEADPNIRLSKVIAAFGPNASGKTNLLRPLALLSWFISNSFLQPAEALIPIHGHFVDLNNDKPCEFLIEFEFGKKIYQYELASTPRKVLKEVLRVKTSTKSSYVFDRTTDHIKQETFGFNQQEAEKVRPNASLISTAAQYQTPIALELKNFFLQFSSNVGPIGRVHFEQLLPLVTKLYNENPKIKEKMLEIMKKIDLGLHDIEFVEEPYIANLANGQPIVQRALLPHGIHFINGKKHNINFNFESNGTRSAFILLFRILSALNQGGLGIIDELEQDFHPDLLEYFLNLFLILLLKLKMLKLFLLLIL
jgi:uncharacterized protein